VCPSQQTDWDGFQISRADWLNDMRIVEEQKARADLRIRVEDQAGHAILDLEKYFRDVEVLILYAGSEQGSGTWIYPSREQWAV